MILVSVGTHTSPFDRLLRAVDWLQAVGRLDGRELVVQAGSSTYKCRAARQFAYCSREEFSDLVHNARLLISHGGIGTLLPALRQGKLVIAIPRLRRWREHNNDHQRDVCDELARQRAIFTSPNADDLGELLNQSPEGLRPFNTQCTIIDRVREELLDFNATQRSRRTP